MSKKPNKKELKLRRDKFIKSLQHGLEDLTGCTIQHDGWPCNTCFHYSAKEILGLNPYLGHLLWLLVLSLRGDYNQVDITDSVLDDMESLIKALMKSPKKGKN